jgi:hypothetical protein
MGAWKAILKLRGGRPPGQPWPAAEQRLSAPEDLRRENERLRKENQRLREKVAGSDQQIADLERQLAGRGALWAKDSTNSSKPPSSDGPAAARRVKPARRPSGRPGPA